MIIVPGGLPYYTALAAARRRSSEADRLAHQVGLDWFGLRLQGFCFGRIA
jgi:hypothetical protein